MTLQTGTLCAGGQAPPSRRTPRALSPLHRRVLRWTRPAGHSWHSRYEPQASAVGLGEPVSRPRFDPFWAQTP